MNDTRFLPAGKIGAALLAAMACFSTTSRAEDLVAHWDFGVEETSKLIAHGGVHRDLPGPRPPEFPDFELINTAVKFDGSGAHFSFADEGPGSPYDFTNGDSITLEAWVNMADMRGGENLYIVGKGRTDDPAFARDNQNWALRVREVDGQACVSFLFATKPAGGADGSHWHRWTSSDGFVPGSGWHHVAASYRFGDPDSVRGWIDGKSTAGTWDMGGATHEPPVVDDDAIWIASSLGGSPSNSFRGLIDEILIHRTVVADEEMAARFRRAGPPRDVVAEVVPELGQIPAGQILVTFHEGLSAYERWPNAVESVPQETTRWLAESFVIPRLPQRYDAWGIRQAWGVPVLVRAAVDLQLPPGKQRFLVRTRGLSRLWVNDKVVARTKPLSGSSDGHQPVPPVPEPPLPGLRRVGYGDQEVFGEAVIGADGRCRVILEAMVGGKQFRPEPGEMCVAVQSADGGSYLLLQSEEATLADPRDLTDAVWDVVAANAETALVQLDDTTRRSLAASQDAFWQKRHALAQQWSAQHPAPAVPESKQTAQPVDAFLNAKVTRALAASAGSAGEEAAIFHSTVLPILRANCFRCHGEKEQGGLRLNSLQAALLGGDSGQPAIVPGDPESSELIYRITTPDDEDRMPLNAALQPEEIATLTAWIKSGAPWPDPPVTPHEVAAPALVDDAKFLRRVWLDTVGVPPTEDEARAFLSDSTTDKRTQLIDRLLADPRFADHWVSYWQDVLAENPNILKPSLNNSGPFRWYLYEALRDDKPLDRLVTELILLRGGKYEGGTAGFGMAADNDAPLAAKAQVLGSAFLGMELQCARCHDSPYHSTTQRDLYSLAAMLDRKPVTVPKTSTVPVAFFEKKARESLIHVTLKPGETISPEWPFAKVCGGLDDNELAPLMQNPGDSRERLAALITAPQNERFARVVVNRVWKRLIGAGIVEPVHDWEGHEPSHPELLDWLAHEFVAQGYDLKQIVRLIMNSQLYQREATGENLDAAPQQRFFVAPERRRLTAEQVVDSLFAAAGKTLNVEELTFDPDSRRPAETMTTLGKPSRAWMFASLSNERDRPSLALPRAQAVTDVLHAFGWTGSRQNPRTDRETDPNVLQPGILENGVMITWITRVTADSGLTQLAFDAGSPEELVDAVFLRFLTRLPSDMERDEFAQVLATGFADRLLPPAKVKPPVELPPLSPVTWSTHLVSEANRIKIEMERRARLGEPPDPRFEPAWRETYEDFVWSVINSPEFVWIP